MIYCHKEKGQNFLKTYTHQLDSDFTSEKIVLSVNIKINEDLNQYIVPKNSTSFTKISKHKNFQTPALAHYAETQTLALTRQMDIQFVHQPVMLTSRLKVYLTQT